MFVYGAGAYLHSQNSLVNNHCHNITAKAYKVLGLLRRSFKTDSTDAKRKLYISLVKSHLLYCSQIGFTTYRCLNSVGLYLDLRVLERYVTGKTKEAIPG